MKMLRTRPDRIGQIFRLRRRHDEDHFVGRLLERLQQRVRGFVGEHVRFVEDHDFVAAARGRVAHHFAQFANLIDAAVGCRVDFNHVEGISEANLAARIALVAGFRGGSLRAVQRFGENARRGSFAHAARAGKNVGMRHAAGLHGVGERARDVLLPDHVGKRLRPPFSRDDLVAHSVGTCTSTSVLIRNDSSPRFVARLFRDDGFLSHHEKIPASEDAGYSSTTDSISPMQTSQRVSDERNFGYSAAHEAIPVPLLPSGPGGVRGTSSHRARSSTHRQPLHSEAAANAV